MLHEFVAWMLRALLAVFAVMAGRGSRRRYARGQRRRVRRGVRVSAVAVVRPIVDELAFWWMLLGREVPKLGELRREIERLYLRLQRPRSHWSCGWCDGIDRQRQRRSMTAADANRARFAHVEEERRIVRALLLEHVREENAARVFRGRPAGVRS